MRMVRACGITCVGRCLVDGDALLRLTSEIVRFNQLLDRLRADVAAGHAIPASDAVLLRRLALRIDDAMARLHGLNADLAAWHAALPDSSSRRQPVGNATRRRSP